MRISPGSVIASLGANRKDKPNGVVAARVLHDGTNGLAVNTRTRIRDQERSPIASDLKRATREKSEMNQPTSALTADVGEAHRQVPIHRRVSGSDLGFRLTQVFGPVHIATVGDFFGISAGGKVSGAIGRLEAGLDRITSSATMSFFKCHAQLQVSLYRGRKQLVAILVIWVGFEMIHSARKQEDRLPDCTVAPSTVHAHCSCISVEGWKVESSVATPIRHRSEFCLDLQDNVAQGSCHRFSSHKVLAIEEAGYLGRLSPHEKTIQDLLPDILKRQAVIPENGNQ